MVGYRFKMQNILNLKENIEKDKMNQLGTATQRLEQEKNILEEIKMDSNDLHNRLKKEFCSGVQVGQLKTLMEYTEYYKRSISGQKVKIKMAEDYMSICRQELIEAAKEKKMMEKLKNIDYNKYLYEEQKIEEKLIDDLVTFKEGKKSME